MTTRPFRQDIELKQNYNKHKAFTMTTSGASAEDAVALAGTMEESNKISFVVELADAYIDFDGTATTSSMLIPAGEGYSDEGIWIGTNISIIRSGSTNARIRGVIWGR